METPKPYLGSGTQTYREADLNVLSPLQDMSNPPLAMSKCRHDQPCTQTTDTAEEFSLARKWQMDQKVGTKLLTPRAQVGPTTFFSKEVTGTLEEQAPPSARVSKNF